MGLMNGNDILKHAQSNKYAVVGLDIFNLESAQAVLCAAEELKFPVFLQVCPPGLKHMGLNFAADILKEIAKEASVPVAIHLDHGPEGSSIDLIKEAIKNGFNSVMVDGSKLSLDENINLTKEVVKFAHSKGVSVEGELGNVSRNINATEEELKALMTKPEEAAEFVKKTKLDYLAISVGSVSGFFKGRIKLDLDRLKEIKESVDVPLVFHGGTSIPFDEAEKAIQLGVCKINVAHGFRKVFVDAFYEELRNDPEQIDPRLLLAKARTKMKEFAMKRIKAYGSS